MKRRNFLKGIVGLAVGAAVAPSILSKEVESKGSFSGGAIFCREGVYSDNMAGMLGRQAGKTMEKAAMDIITKKNLIKVDRFHMCDVGEIVNIHGSTSCLDGLYKITSSTTAEEIKPLATLLRTPQRVSHKEFYLSKNKWSRK